MDKEKLIGRKMRGFAFKNRTNGVFFTTEKEDKIGEIGIIINIVVDNVDVIFNNNIILKYPLSMVAEHLIDEPAEEKIQAPEKGIIINVSESDGNFSYKLDSFNMSAIETLGLLELISNQIKIKLNNQNPAI